MDNQKKTNRIIIISSDELKQLNQIGMPDKAADFANTAFWYYTSLHTADLILLNNSIFISNIAIMNDLDEANLHKSDNMYTHCLCFCNSNSEKIPMWYLYAGITGKGVSFGITPSVMLELINSIEHVVAVDDGTILIKGKDFDFDYGWVYYRKMEDNKQVKFKGKLYSLKDPDAFEINNYYIKSYPWEYEKEFRIVFHNKTGISHERLKVDISSIYNKLKIKLAPELSKELFRDYLPSLKGFSRFLESVPEHSKLGINMDLCKRNYDGFLEYINAVIREKGGTEVDEITKICDAIRDSSKCRELSKKINY